MKSVSNDLSLQISLMGNYIENIIFVVFNATYDICLTVIGALKNTVQLARRKRGEELLQEVKLPNLLSDKQQTKVIVQISEGKYILSDMHLVKNVNR